MNKLWLIIQREYLSRVTKKAFILTTILTPIGFVIFWIALIYIMSSGVEEKKLAVIDTDQLLQIDSYGKLNDGTTTFKYPEESLEQLKESFEEKGYDGILHIPSQNFDSLTRTFNMYFYANTNIGKNTQNSIKKAIAMRIRKIKMDAFGIDPLQLKQLDTDVKLTTQNLLKEEEETSDSKVVVATILGMMMMFLIYFVIFIYGNMVMRSVMEEKTNRIVEVIISSVKPFQLMLGKIVGVGAVGLTQFAIWGAVFPLLFLGVQTVFSSKIAALQIATSTAENTGQMDKIMVMIQDAMTFDYGYILGFFLIYFILGYILYASLFAAIGAAMGDDTGEGQSLTLIVAIPVITAFYIGISVINNPTSTLATWSSMFPFFSPIVMPARIVFNPPIGEVIASLVILFFTCLLFIWISGRIYRIGILMYGKKIGLKDFIMWMFRKN